MRLKYLALGLAAVIAAPVATAQAADGIFVPLFTYRTGAVRRVRHSDRQRHATISTCSTSATAASAASSSSIEECETGYDTKKGVECYDAGQGQEPGRGQSVFDRHHAAAHPQGRGRQDPDPLDGLRPFGLGRRQPVPVDLQSAGDLLGRRLGIRASYVGDAEGGFDKLKGKKIGLVYLDAPYGKEPIPLLAGARQGLRLRAQALSGAGAEMQNQSSLWLNVRRDRPDWIYLQGWGAMNPTAVKEAAKIDFPMDHLVGVWWAGSDDDARPAGAGGQGLLVARLQRGRHRTSR